MPTFLDVAKAYDNQLKKLKSENDRLHAVVQKPLDPGEALRDDELVHRFESLRRCIEKACRDNTRKVARDVNFDVQLKTIAVLTEHIHRHIYEMPYFGMKVTIEDGLRGFEEDLFSKLGMLITTLFWERELDADQDQQAMTSESVNGDLQHYTLQKSSKQIFALIWPP